MQVDDDILDKLRAAYLSLKDVEGYARRALHEEGSGMDSDFDQLMKVVALLLGESE